MDHTLWIPDWYNTVVCWYIFSRDGMFEIAKIWHCISRLSPNKSYTRMSKIQLCKFKSIKCSMDTLTLHLGWCSVHWKAQSSGLLVHFRLSLVHVSVMSPPGIFVLSVMSNDIQSIVIFVGYSEIEVTVDESPETVVGVDVGRSVVSIGSLKWFQ